MSFKALMLLHSSYHRTYISHNVFPADHNGSPSAYNHVSDHSPARATHWANVGVTFVKTLLQRYPNALASDYYCPITVIALHSHWGHRPPLKQYPLFAECVAHCCFLSLASENWPRSRENRFTCSCHHWLPGII